MSQSLSQTWTKWCYCSSGTKYLSETGSVLYHFAGSSHRLYIKMDTATMTSPSGLHSLASWLYYLSGHSIIITPVHNNIKKYVWELHFNKVTLTLLFEETTPLSLTKSRSTVVMKSKLSNKGQSGLGYKCIFNLWSWEFSQWMEFLGINIVIIIYLP